MQKTEKPHPIQKEKKKLDRIWRWSNTLRINRSFENRAKENLAD
jgi:hypothetical protein